MVIKCNVLTAGSCPITYDSETFSVLSNFSLFGGSEIHVYWIRGQKMKNV